jgi:serine/threonine protein kinase
MEARICLVLSVVRDEDKCPHVMYPTLAPQMTPDGRQYIVFERATSDLAYVLRSGPLPVDDLRRLFDSMIGALRYLKEDLQIVHNDIKPENIMVMRDGTFQLGDFGCATIPNEWAEWCGTTVYMAPEMVARLIPTPTYVSYSSDIWGLGMVMNEALCGATEWLNEDGHVRTELPPVIFGRCKGTLRLRRAQRVAGGDPRLDRIHDFIEAALVENPHDRPAVEDVELAGDAEKMQM